MDYPQTYEGISSSGQICTRPPRNVNFFINALLHMVILLTIVSAFYFAFVSKLSQQKFREELTDLIASNLGPALQSADKNGALKDILKTLNMDRITQYYQNKSDRAITIQNRWLFRLTLISILFVIFTIVLSIYILKISCHQCAPFSHILKENLVLFFFVGIVEVSFFLFIARKFVPTRPSLMMKSIIDSLKNKFKTD